jgi:type I restriction enzyme, S subunit
LPQKPLRTAPYRAPLYGFRAHLRLAFEVVESSLIDDLISTALDVANGETQKLDDVLKITDCKHKTPKLSGTGIPMVAPGNISWGPLQLAGCKQVSRDDYEMLMDHVDVNPMDLVLSRNQNYGIASYVESDTKFAIGQDTVLMQPKEISTKTAFIILKSEFLQRQIERLCAGSTFKRINLGEIRKLLFPVMGEDIESRAMDLFDIFEFTRKSLENEQEELVTFRTTLMNNLVLKGRNHA